MNAVTPSQELDFQHVFVPGETDFTLLLLHGTGGDENDLVPLGRTLAPKATLLSPRGKILEHGAPRFFRRLAEGVFDEEDLIKRTHELADFIAQATAKYGFDPAKVYAVGFSNGANIAASLLLLRPKALAGAALLRAMVPLVPETAPVLTGKPVLIAAGHLDPIVPGENSRSLAEMLRAAGANVVLRFENAGHGLTPYTVETAQRWIQEEVR